MTEPPGSGNAGHVATRSQAPLGNAVLEAPLPSGANLPFTAALWFGPLISRSGASNGAFTSGAWERVVLQRPPRPVFAMQQLLRFGDVRDLEVGAVPVDLFPRQDRHVPEQNRFGQQTGIVEVGQ